MQHDETETVYMGVQGQFHHPWYKKLRLYQDQNQSSLITGAKVLVHKKQFSYIKNKPSTQVHQFLYNQAPGLNTGATVLV